MDEIDAVALTQWHVVSLVGNRIVAANRLTGANVYDQVILDRGQKALGLCVDLQKNTFWLFTSQEIFEIVVRDEDRDIWKIMLKMQQFDAALQYAHTPAQKDAVATASGDYLISKGLFGDAAGVYGKSSKPFEEVALTFVDNNQPDALRRYLLAKLGTYKRDIHHAKDHDRQLADRDIHRASSIRSTIPLSPEQSCQRRWIRRGRRRN